MGYLFCTKPYFASGSAGVWQAVKQMPVAIRFPSALPGFGKIFIAHCKSDFVEYNVASGTYTNRGNMHGKFFKKDPGEGFAFLRGNQVFMTTGNIDANNSRFIVITVNPEFYVLQANSSDRILRHLRYCGVVRIDMNSFFAFGGISYDNKLYNTICEVNLQRNFAYIRSVTLSMPLIYLSATQCSGAYYAAGGINGSTVFSKLIKYTEQTNEVEYFDMPASIAGCCLVGHAGKVYVFGGATWANFTNVVNTVYAFDVVTKRWETLPPMPAAVANAGGCVLPDKNEIHIFGGWNGSAMMNTHQIFKLD